ncbi:hypothetical protein GCG54_00009349 [Colletotrichum gloeosporioides]|uniref:Extracellular membrane protein CFEM domain-containing protein n=1 Tax=Colletotrichum gloeosporioides TaxID=474922 RepID=A0A8H4C5A7_COLGL|nr:uncharacterized protein GCG54_00009349 [Colletotrichum gloeosporioides]KAF3797378.1 hypothetical protein GCG54_00009349 [Colletotrichum gloeosporioides]
MQFSKITILLTAAVMYAAGVSASCQQIKCDKTCGSGGAKKNFCGSIQCNDLNRVMKIARKTTGNWLAF